MAGQVYSSSRRCRRPSVKGAGSFVTKLESRALTGNKPQLTIHQRVGYDVHETWRIGDDVTTKYFNAADHCFERCFNAGEECDAFCEELRQNPIKGMCDLWMGCGDLSYRIYRD